MEVGGGRGQIDRMKERVIEKSKWKGRDRGSRVLKNGRVDDIKRRGKKEI